MIATFIVTSLIISAFFAFIALVFPDLGRFLEKLGIATAIIMIIIAIYALWTGNYWLLEMIVNLLNTGPQILGADAAWAVIIASAGSMLISYVIDPEGTEEAIDTVVEGTSKIVGGIAKTIASGAAAVAGGIASGLGINLGWLLAGAGGIAAYYLLGEGDEGAQAIELSLDSRNLDPEDEEGLL